MALAEYELNGFTYLFDVDHVPNGATLVTQDIAVADVTLFPDQITPAAEEPKAEPETPKNKAAKAPATKAEPVAVTTPEPEPPVAPAAAE